MRSDDLTPLQLQAIRTGLTPLARYLAKLRARMCERGFEADDELLALVTKADNAVDRLSIELHYRSCKSGVGRKAKDG